MHPPRPAAFPLAAQKRPLTWPRGRPMSEAGGAGDPAQASPVAGPSDDEWIAACRRAVEVQHRVFDEHRTIEQRTQYEGVGEGGDRTLAIDRLCEDAIFAELEGLHQAGHEFTAVSEERGSVT